MRRVPTWFCVLGFCFIGTILQPLYAQELKAGAFAISINPEQYPISVNGGMADRLASKANDPLHARCFVITSGSTSIAIVTVDSCMLPRELIDDAKAQAEKLSGIPARQILVSATHTHTAPTSTGIFQSDPDEKYVKYLAKRIAEGIAQAKKQELPAEIGWAVTDEPSQLFNRRWKLKPGTVPADPFGNTTDLVKMNPGYGNPNLIEPAGPIDPGLTILAARTRTGLPIALHANYSLHYVGDFPALSADYFGVFSEEIGSMIGAKADAKPAFMGALSNGTSGDVNNVDFKNGMPMKTMPGEKCRKVGNIAALAAKKAYGQATFHQSLPVAVAEKEIELKVRKPSEADLKRARELLEMAGKTPLKIEGIYARESVLLAQYPDTVRLKIQAIRIGDLAITAIPCEVFTEIGLNLKKQSPFKTTFNISLANGYNGYLPTPAQHALGGYETWRARSSYLEVKASDAITETLLGLLKDLHTQK